MLKAVRFLNNSLLTSVVMLGYSVMILVYNDKRILKIRFQDFLLDI